MLEVVDYIEGNMFTIGNSVRNALSLRRGQTLFIYEVAKEKRVFIYPYEIKKTLYGVGVKFNKIEDFQSLSLDLSKNGVNIIFNRIYKDMDGLAIDLVYEVPPNLTEECTDKDFVNTLSNLVNANNLELRYAYWYKDQKVTLASKVFIPLIEYSLRKPPFKTKLSKNGTIFYKLSNGFKGAIGFTGKKKQKLKCVQLADLEICRIILTFHSSKVKRVRIRTLNVPGSLARLLFILKHLNLKIEANVTRCLGYSIGELVEALCALNYSSIDAPKNEFENAKQLKEKFQATDHKLAEINEEYKELKERKEILGAR